MSSAPRFFPIGNAEARATEGKLDAFVERMKCLVETDTSEWLNRKAHDQPISSTHKGPLRGSRR